MLSTAVKEGDDKMAKHVLRFKPDIYTVWKYKDDRYTERMVKEGVSVFWSRSETCSELLYTPNVQVYRRMRKALEARKLVVVGTREKVGILFHAMLRGWIEMARYITGHVAPLGRSYTTSWVHYPLDVACKYGPVDMSTLLCDMGAQIRGSELDFAAADGHLQIIKILLEKDADVHAAASRNALYAAVEKGYLGVTRMLLDAGMDPNTGDRPPLLGVVRSEHECMFRLLVERGALVSCIGLDDRREANADIDDVRVPQILDSMMVLLDEYGARQSAESVR